MNSKINKAPVFDATLFRRFSAHCGHNVEITGHSQYDGYACYTLKCFECNKVICTIEREGENSGT